MDLELITVGTELLLGFTLDTNAVELARTLGAIGVRVVRRSTVGDDETAIRDAVTEALRRSRFVIVTGGLGPTRDDVTKRAVAQALDLPLDSDPALLAELERRFARLGRGPMPAANRTQALVPRGATVLPNPVGTAPGLWIDHSLGTTVLLPGVPHEMRTLLASEVVPRLRIRLPGGGALLASRTLRTAGISESALADRLGSVEEALAPVELAYLPGLDGVDLRLVVRAASPGAAQDALDRAESLLAPALGAHLYGHDAQDLAGALLRLLRAAHVRLAVAESCTGGMLGARLTAIPGASDVFSGGVICYDNRSKVRDLGVSPETLETHGAVSEPVARAMASGVARRFGAEAAVAVTGIAGPTGGTPEKPVGTVWLAAWWRGELRTDRRQFLGERDVIRARATAAALDLVRRLALEAQDPSRKRAGDG